MVEAWSAKVVGANGARSPWCSPDLAASLEMAFVCGSSVEEEAVNADQLFASSCEGKEQSQRNNFSFIS